MAHAQNQNCHAKPKREVFYQDVRDIALTTQ